MKKPYISVVIPAYNEEKLIGKCLGSVLNQDFPKDQYEVIVVNNNSTDKTAEIANRAGAHVVRERKKGYSRALIKGISSSRGEIIAFTDADCETPINWLSKISSAFAENNDLDAVGGTLAVSDNKSLRSKTISFLWKLTPNLCGGNMAIKKQSLDKIGSFNPNMNYGVDLYLSYRLKKNGKVIIDRSNLVSTSGRRFKKRLFLEFLIKPSLNYCSLIFFHKPLFSNFSDVR